MNCDRLARWYSTMEYLSFGSALLSCRCRQLAHCQAARKVLMLGEGDGRFLRRFLRQNTCAEVDYVDASARMLSRARQCLTPDQRARVHFHLADAISFKPRSVYDTIVTHFFLDCLWPGEVSALAATLAESSTPSASWIVSEFQITGSGWRRLRSRLWIGGLYVAFRWLTELSVSEIPNYRVAMEKNGFQLASSHTFSAGLLTSQLWKKRL